MGEPALVVVEHADTGETTLHRADCPHIRRAIYVHPVTGPVPDVDHVCRTCKGITCPA